MGSPMTADRAEQPDGTEARWIKYVDLVEEIWSDVQPLIGSITLSALFTSAIRHAAAEYAFLEGVTATNAGITREMLEEKLSPQAPDQAAAAMACLVKHLMAIFESVAGPIIVRQIMPKVIRAEQ